MCALKINFNLNLLQNSRLQLLLSILNGLNLSLNLLNRVHFKAMLTSFDFINILAEPGPNSALVALESLNLLPVLLLDLASELLGNFQVLGFQGIN